MYGSPDNPLFDTIGAAKFLGLQKKTLEFMRYQRRGPNFVKLGRLIRYRQSDLEAYVNSNVQNVMKPAPIRGKR
jgi:predicted DNA-binding transcriptional regulator AlpA